MHRKAPSLCTDALCIQDGQTAIELVKANYLRLDAQKIAAVEAVLREHGATEQ
jgi:hypothetical protein